mgnify:CR=1 FL=1
MPKVSSRSSGKGIGLVPLDSSGSWRGGRYYLHHLVRSVMSLPEPERVPLFDVHWGRADAEDTFEEVRSLMSGARVIAPPSGLLPRAARKVRRTIRGIRDARDLFLDADIAALFPILPCENAGLPFVFWLSDFQYRHLPELYTPQLLEWFANHNNRNVAIASRVVLSSQHAFDEFVQVYPKHAEKGRILRFSSIPDDEWWMCDPKIAVRKYHIDAPYVIVSNQFAHNKNHDVIFAAMQRLKLQGRRVELVCTGSTSGFHGGGYMERLQAYIAEHDLGGRIKLLGLVPRADQIALLRGALALLQPSRFEGWSTIIEDAKSIGQTVLASDFPVHCEQLGGAQGKILPMDDADIWADAISDLLDGRLSSGAKFSREEAEARADAAARITGRTFISIMHEAEPSLVTPGAVV